MSNKQSLSEKCYLGEERGEEAVVIGDWGFVYLVGGGTIATLVMIGFALGGF
jgi:hypothetical protein